ncbi:hypothetical protein VNO77_14912 [Canavalia gladiata]|uniref:Uncharacterized protein n=1 Tax=Canavalia gladiata TaxID=3824 RepID=A0AAN9LZ40_CANGL
MDKRGSKLMLIALIFHLTCVPNPNPSRIPRRPKTTFYNLSTLKHYAHLRGDIDLEDHVEKLMVSLDPSKTLANKIPTSPPKKYTAISMLNEIGNVYETTIREWLEDISQNQIHKILQGLLTVGLLIAVRVGFITNRELQEGVESA